LQGEQALLPDFGGVCCAYFAGVAGSVVELNVPAGCGNGACA